MKTAKEIFYVVSAVLTGLFLLLWITLSGEPETTEATQKDDTVSYSEDGKTATLQMEGETTEYSIEETVEIVVQKDRVWSIGYQWVKDAVKEVCYPDIKKDLKEGLEKFGYYHVETHSLIHKKCDVQEKLRDEAKFIGRDKQLMELVN